MRCRILCLLLMSSVAVATYACGGGRDVTSAPTGCAAALSPASQNAPAAGGTFAVSITVSQSCEWTAAADAGWVTLMRTSGSGSGSAAYTVAPNTTADGRNARVRIGNESVVVTQSPANCSYSVDPSSASVPSSGGTQEFRLTTSNGCTWSASATDPWISLPAASGSGPRTLSAVIAPNTASTPRSGSIQVEGQTITISQEGHSSTPGSCSFDVSPREQTVGAAGGRIEIRLSATSDACGWSAQAGAGWIQLERTSGSGSGTVAASVARNDRPDPRTATIQAGGAVITVNQQGVNNQPVCAVTLSATAFNIAATGGTAPVDVTAGPGCTWQTEGRPDWIRQNPESGSGSGRTTFTVAANTNPSARTATILIGKQAATFTQAGACAYALSGTSQSVGSTGGTFSVTLKTEPACEWTAKTSQSWITVTPASGVGSRTVSYSVAANTTPAKRDGNVLIATETVTVTQDPAACEFKLTSDGQTVGTDGGSVEFGVRTLSGCGWKATTRDAWIQSVTPNGSGDGTVRATVTPNDGAAERRGSIQVDGHTFTVTQQACSYKATWVSAATKAGGPIEAMTAAAAGDTLVVSVRTGTACTWKHSSAPVWIPDLRAAEYRGSVDFKIPVTCNTGREERRGSMTIAGLSASILQPFDPRVICR